MAQYRHSQWKGKTGGTPWMQRALIPLARVTPLVVLYGIMALVVPFYMLFNHKGYLATWHFFRRRLGYGPARAFVSVYRNHFVFGQVILDRFAMYAGKNFEFVLPEREYFGEMTAGEEGLLIAGSHVGNYELAGYSLDSRDKAFHALVFGGETETVMNGRNRMLGRNHISLIRVSEDMSHIFAINNALAEGGIVSLHCDRVFGSGKSVECDFFGSKAVFPAGGFNIACMRSLPMLAVFVMKDGLRRYRVFEVPVECSGSSRKEMVASMAQNFASALEDVVRQYPHQWFNYYEFWND